MRRLTIGAIVAVVLVLVNVALGLRNAREQEADARLVLHTEVVLGSLARLLSSTIEVESAVRGFLLTGRDTYVADYDGLRASTERELARLDSLLADNRTQRGLMPPLRAAIRQRLDLLDLRLDAYRTAGRDSAMRVVGTEVGRWKMDSIRAQITVMNRMQRALLEDRSNDLARSNRFTALSAALAGLATMAGLAVFLLILARHLDLTQSTALRVAAQREQLRTTLSSIGDGVITTDEEASVRSMNPEAQRLTGWSEADAIGEPLESIFQVINEESRLPVENPARRSLREGSIVGLANHSVLIARDGTERPIDDSAAPIRASNDEIIGCVLVFRDVSERRATEAELRRSQRRLQSALDGARMVAFELNPTDMSLSTSENATVVLGLAPGAQLTSLEQALELVHHGDVAHVRATVTDAVANRRSFHILFRLTRPLDGAIRWLEVHAQPSRDEMDEKLRIVGVALDVTDRRRSVEAMRESEVRFRSMADNAPVIIWISDCSGACTYLNRQWLEVTGAMPGEDLGTRWLERIHPDERDAFGAALAALRDAPSAGDAAPFRLELRLRQADGSWRWTLHSASPRLDSEQRSLGWIGSAIDLEDRKVMERDLRALAADLSLAHRRKDEFLATLAHELRNPLAPIRNALEIIRRVQPHGSEAVVKARSIVERQFAQLVRLVDDLLDVSRITGGKLELRCETIALSDVLLQAIETSRPHIDGGEHTLDVTLPSHAIHLHADVTRLSQVFANLLNNAAKYSEPGRTIHVSVQEEGDTVVVRIRDEGVGIANDLLPDVFDLFMQADRSLERSQGGLGVGLTLVKRLVEMHGGSVEARSDGIGRGSEFLVRLPVLRAQVDAPAPERTDNGRVARTPCRVLIADDNADAAASLAELLRLDGHAVRIVSDGLQAVSAAESMHPDAILLDIGMPHLNGFDACARIRSSAWARNTLIVALTGWGQLDARERSEQAGFDRHLVKPVDPAELSTLLASLPNSATTPGPT
ncbi:MAG: PAS domain S-box protein [Gemmatimonadaceae bacterium]|nr:PAS domain S-box protein [Gemmatimonadaceae bacterium]